jgi:hypothetical protein
MTVAETIKQKAETLAPDKQLEVLDFVEFLERRNGAHRSQHSTTESVKQAIASAAGIWKDRTDLPEDSAQAAQRLRDRAAQRGTP